MTDFNTTIESANAFILDACLRTTCVLLVTVLIGWSLRSAAASSRRLVWISGLTASLMVPLMMVVGPSVPVVISRDKAPQQDIAAIDRVETVDSNTESPRQADFVVAEVVTTGRADELFLDTAKNEIAQPLVVGPSELTLAARERRTQQADSVWEWILAWPTWTVVVLLPGIAAKLVQLVVGNFRVHGLVRKATDDIPQEWINDWRDAKVKMQVGDTILLRAFPAEISPLACGVFRRIVLLPTSARDWGHDRLQAVMQHELGHVRQRDVAAIQLGQLAAAVFFFHPLVWFVVRQLRLDCERACDDLVLNAGQKPVDYARHLTEIARSFSTSRHQNTLAMAMSRSSNIESRVTAILDADIPRQSLSSVARRSAMAIALLLGVIVAAPRAGHSQMEEEVTPAPARMTATDDASRRSPVVSTYKPLSSSKPRHQRTDAGNVFTAQSAPQAWNVNTGENILWSAELGSQTYGSPTVSGGKIFIGTNNGGGHLEQFPDHVDLGCLLAFDVQSGKFLWQYSAEKLPTGRVNDWPQRGIPASPYVAGDRLWVVTNRSEVVCMDTEGFYDGEDDGPLFDGPGSRNFSSGDTQIKKRADVVWTLDLMKTFGSFPHNHSDCTITSDGRLLFIVVPNGTDHTHSNLPSPDVPSFVALDAKTGAVVWTNRDSENRILHGQWSSASYCQLGGMSQVVCPGGSGWLFGLDASTGETLWKFDCNPKDSKWILGSKGRRNNLIAKPLIYDGRVFMATGQDPEHGEGNADLWCIDPTKRGDVSPQIVDRSQFVQNPNSAVVWHFDQEEFTPNGEPVFEHFFHRSICTPVAKDGLLIAVDTAGLVHCFDAKTGQRFWTHDLFAACLSSPIIINSQVYIGDEDGDVAILAFSKQLEVIAEVSLGEAILTTPAVSDGVLFQATRSRLFAIKSGVPGSKVVASTNQKTNPHGIQKQIKQLTAALDFAKEQEAKATAERAKLEQLQKALQIRLESLQNSASKVTN